MATAPMAARAMRSARAGPRNQGGCSLRRRAARCEAAPTSTPASALGGTPVKKTSVLVVGATGTLGRQVVRKLLDDGYDVRCVVRPRPIPADFLRDWGASTVSCDLLDPETIPATMVGVHTVIDCATSRPEEDMMGVDWRGKTALIQTAKAMGIQRYVYFSIANCDKYPNVPLMQVKKRTEDYLAEVGLDYTTIRLCGFMQALVGQYAVPILDEQKVWGTSSSSRVAYMDAVDVAKMTSKVLSTDAVIGKTLTFSGKRSYSSDEIVRLCTALSGSEEPDVNEVPALALRATRAVMSFFQWTRSVADRLAFVDVMGDSEISADMKETYQLLGMNESEVATVEDYLQEYFDAMLSKLKEVRAESKSTDFYL